MIPGELPSPTPNADAATYWWRRGYEEGRADAIRAGFAAEAAK